MLSSSGGHVVCERGGGSLVYDTSWFRSARRRSFDALAKRCLVLGASGAVGLASVRLAKAIGAKVLAVSLNPDKARDGERRGADRIIDLSADNLRDSLREQVYKVTDSKVPDIILDMLAAISSMRPCARWPGRDVLVVMASALLWPMSDDQGELSAAEKYRSQRTCRWERLSQTAPAAGPRGLLCRSVLTD